MSNRESRRKFLMNASKSLGLLGISPVMSNLIIQSITSQASAQTAVSASDRIYIYFSLPGAPPRWLFDAPLTPNGTADKYTDAFSHPGLGTFVGMAGANDPQAMYKPWYDPQSKYWLPPVWGSHPNGGSFKNCLANALFVRGLDMQIDSHEVGGFRNQAPIFGGLSIGGLLSEKTGSVFPAVTQGNIAAAFKAEKPIAPVGLNYRATTTENPILDIMRFFSGKAPITNLAVQKALSEFEQYAVKNQFDQKSLTQSKEKSDSLVKLGIKSFTDKWAPTYSKYLSKIQEALLDTNTTLMVDTKALILPAPAVDGTPNKRLMYAPDTYLGNLTDLKSIITTNTNAGSMAAAFAATEILITMGLTQVMTADIYGLSDLKLNNAGGMFGLSQDQHFVGNLISTLGSTYYFRSVLNCTEELVTALKAKNLFDKTIIQFGCEFGRNPTVDGSGSDHAPAGSSALIISGMIAKTAVIGNTQTDTNTRHKGTWGLSAPHPVTESNRSIRINDLAKTICGMLNIKNVSNNGVYILRNIGGSQWDLFPDNRGEAKNV